MKHIFYLIGVCFIIHEIMWVLHPFKQLRKSKNCIKLTKENKGKKFDDFSGEFKEILFFQVIPNLIYFFWMFIGLLTFNWVAFILMIIIQFLIIWPLGKLLEKTIGYVVLHWLNSIIGFSFGIFIILNSYHLKLDLYEIVRHFINCKL
jgi:hypothetical protein